MPRSIEKEIIIDQTEEKIFESLIRPRLIIKWWSAHQAIVIPEINGLHAVSWGTDDDNPEYVTAARISEIKPPIKLSLTDFKYLSKNGKLPFKAELEIQFTIESAGDKSKLVIKQTGFPDEAVADDFFSSCIKGWENTLSSIKKVVEDDDTWY